MEFKPLFPRFLSLSLHAGPGLALGAEDLEAQGAEDLEAQGAEDLEAQGAEPVYGVQTSFCSLWAGWA